VTKKSDDAEDVEFREVAPIVNWMKLPVSLFMCEAAYLLIQSHELIWECLGTILGLLATGVLISEPAMIIPFLMIIVLGFFLWLSNHL